MEKNFTTSGKVLKAVDHHHERGDSSGYPYGLTKNQISKFDKIIGVFDVYDDVSNDRCYRKNKSY